MNIIDRSQLIDSLLKQKRAYQAITPVVKNLPAVVPSSSDVALETKTDVRPSETVLQGLAAAQPKLVSETLDTLERGFRRTQVFRQSDGRNFIRNEEVTLTERGLKRTVTQENPSGSTVEFEENLDRQTDGNFRRTVRFTDEIGAVQTKVEDSKTGIDPFIASSGSYREPASPYQLQRGLSLDISA